MIPSTVQAIQNELEDKLAELILEGTIKRGNKVKVTVKDKKLSFGLKRGTNK